MGNARWNSDRYADYTDSIRHKSQREVFGQQGIHADLDPKNIKVREAFDSPANPQAHPVIIGCDETGSMGILAEIIIRRGLGTIMDLIYKHKPVPDPQIMCMGLGDTRSDRAPLQMTQFEADAVALTKQVEQIYIEGNGGGNGGESYSLAWWAAVNKTNCHAITKRHRKGYLFTIGDECFHPKISAGTAREFLGVGIERDLLAEELLAQARRFWNVYHLIVAPVAYQPVMQEWDRLLGRDAIMVEDHEKLAEIIVAIIRLNEGQDNVTDGYDQGTAQIVAAATQRLLPAAG